MAELSDFRVEGEALSPYANIEPLQTDYRGHVLAFDQTLGSTGWVNFYVAALDCIIIRSAGTILTTGNARLTIAADSYRRAAEIRPTVAALVRGVASGGADSGSRLVVMELPPTGGRNLKQTTSSFLAGFVVHEEAGRVGLSIEIVQAQKAKKRWTGNPSASKMVVREALVYHFPGLASMRPLNEHTTDALLLGLTAIDGYTVK